MYENNKDYDDNIDNSSNKNHKLTSKICYQSENEEKSVHDHLEKSKDRSHSGECDDLNMRYWGYQRSDFKKASEPQITNTHKCCSEV